MTTQLVKIGNSQCLRIPMSIIKQCNFKKEVLIKVINNNLLIEPINSSRNNWEKLFYENYAEEKPMVDASNIFDNTEWEW